MKSPIDRASFKALGQGMLGRGGLGAMAESALMGWRAAQAMRASGAFREGCEGAAAASGATGCGACPHASAGQHGRLEALGWFLTAGVILLWPRAQSPSTGAS